MIIFKQKEYSLFSRGLRFFKELKKIGKLPITLEEFSKLMILEISKKRDDPEYKNFLRISIPIIILRMLSGV